MSFTNARLEYVVSYNVVRMLFKSDLATLLTGRSAATTAEGITSIMKDAIIPIARQCLHVPT